jgi:hypothetical protein
MMTVGWFYVLETSEGEILFLEGESLTQNRRYEHALSIT